MPVSRTRPERDPGANKVVPLTRALSDVPGFGKPPRRQLQCSTFIPRILGLNQRGSRERGGHGLRGVVEGGDARTLRRWVTSPDTSQR